MKNLMHFINRFFGRMAWTLGSQAGFAALTPTKVAMTELSGDLKLYVATVVPTSESDTITFVAATHKFRKIYGAWGVIQAGLDANFALLQISFSGLVVTIANFEADGTVGTDWTSAVIRLFVVVGSAD
jgi:hypothetical protein